MDGKLYLSSDGAWQKEIDPCVCSCAFIVKCTESKQELKCTWVERGESASNYRAELLSAIGYLLFMKAVLPDIRTTDCDVTTLPKCKAFCDNMGVVNHGKQPKKPLSEKQVQVDLLGHMKYLLRTLQARISFTHVYGHNKHDWDDMTKEQQLNTRNDKDAGEALEKAVEKKEYIKKRLLSQAPTNGMWR